MHANSSVLEGFFSSYLWQFLFSGRVHEVWVGLVGPYVMARPPPAPQCILRGVGAAVNTLHFSCDRPDPPLLFSG